VVFRGPGDSFSRIGHHPAEQRNQYLLLLRQLPSTTPAIPVDRESNVYRRIGADHDVCLCNERHQSGEREIKFDLSSTRRGQSKSKVQSSDVEERSSWLMTMYALCGW